MLAKNIEIVIGIFFILKRNDPLWFPKIIAIKCVNNELSTIAIKDNTLRKCALSFNICAMPRLCPTK
jgi:hypothetical protein